MQRSPPAPLSLKGQVNEQQLENGLLSYHSVVVPSHCKYCTCATASCSAGHRHGHCSTTLYHPTRPLFHGFPTSQYHTTHPLFLYTTSHHLTIVHHFFTSLHVYCTVNHCSMTLHYTVSLSNSSTTLYCSTWPVVHSSTVL